VCASEDASSACAVEVALVLTSSIRLAFHILIGKAGKGRGDFFIAGLVLRYAFAFRRTSMLLEGTETKTSFSN
jgi:hypothetical protein